MQAFKFTNYCLIFKLHHTPIRQTHMDSICHIFLLIQWHALKEILPCRWYITRAHNHNLSFLQAEWIPMLADCVNLLSQVVGYMGALEVSSSHLAVFATHWYLDGDPARDPNQKMKPSCFNTKGNWRTGGSIDNWSVGNMSGIWDPKHFTEWSCVKGIQSEQEPLRLSMLKNT